MDARHPLIAQLQAKGALGAHALERAVRASVDSGVRIDRTLRALGLVPDEVLTAAAVAVSGIALHDGEAPDAESVGDLGLPESFMRSARCIPLRFEGEALLLGIEDAFDGFAVAAVAARTGLVVVPRLLAPGSLERLIDGLRRAPREATEVSPETAGRDDVERLRDLASDAPIIRLVAAMIDRAVDARASDVHLTALPGGASRLRLRVDGLLRDVDPPAAGLHAAVVSRLKIMAGLDIGERRLPQDGRIKIGARGRLIDLRVATMPHAHGEGVVLRILDRSTVALAFESLGLSEAVTRRLGHALAQPNGMVLVTGPTGSGKTTTLYAALRRLATPEMNVVTVEDPIEYELDGVAQIQVARQIGLDFATCLRSVLRQDPDVVMVGEIRDRETAIVATQAALTGHLVLATVHTNSAAGAIPRLIDLGVDPFLVASTVRGVLAQRLVRRLCSTCRRPSSGSDVAWTAVGCEACGGTGYQGRLAIADFLAVTPEIAALTTRAADESAIAAAAGGDQIVLDAEEKIRCGLTTRSEVLRTIGSR